MKNSYSFLKLFFLSLVISVCGGICFANAQKPSVFSKHNTAIHGYDPVSYFTENKAVKGSSEHTFHWMETDWHFASEANKTAFSKSPGKYAPAFGGYCAYAVGKGYTAPTDPKAFAIVEGILYLNYNQQVQQMWESDRDQLISEGNKNWPKVLSAKQD